VGGFLGATGLLGTARFFSPAGFLGTTGLFGLTRGFSLSSGFGLPGSFFGASLFLDTTSFLGTAGFFSLTGRLGLSSGFSLSRGLLGLALFFSPAGFRFSLFPGFGFLLLPLRLGSLTGFFLGPTSLFGVVDFGSCRPGTDPESGGVGFLPLEHQDAEKNDGDDSQTDIKIKHLLE
jgi:hypothetical protein